VLDSLIAKENRESLIDSVRNADNIIIIAPNYIHSIPAGTLDFIYTCPNPEKSIHRLYQPVRYPESSESELSAAT
jgi:NAD(P)H-dependent FMN reductase